MKTKAICLLALAFLAGVALADGQKTATYDSLNVRVVWTFHGAREFGGLAMAPDTTLWTCYPGTHTLIKIDASDPDVIDTNFYAIDTAIIGVKEVLDDSMLITISFDGTYFHFQVININLSPPAVVASYVSPHLSNHRGNTASRIINDMYFTMDNTSIGDLAIFDLSDPFNIDTIATAIDRGIGNWFEIIDTLLYVTYFAGSGSGGWYSNTYCIRIFNISDIYNPIYDTTLSYITRGATTSVLQCPSVIVDTLMFVAANYYEGPLADVYSIADPTSPVYLGEIGVSSWMWDKYVIDYQNGYLYSGMWIHDVTGYPTTDSLVGYIDGQPTSLKICGKYIYQICGDTFGITEFYEYDPNHVFVPEIKTPPTKEQFFLSPNPVYKYANVRLPYNSTGQIGIFNILGQQIAHSEIIPDRSSYDFDLSNCPNGVYLVSVTIGGNHSTKKIVLMG